MSPYLGRGIGAAEIDDTLAREGLSATTLSPADVARRLTTGDIGAVMTGRAEVGPRALCHRSIIASPADPGMRDRVNLAKGRELWRPLGPVGIAGHTDGYWAPNPHLQRYMIGSSDVTATGWREVPSVVHIDGSARPQVPGHRGCRSPRRSRADRRPQPRNSLQPLRTGGGDPPVPDRRERTRP
ncbi:carbamoyltransferase C-terminal domain-containing protein [Streptomyces clavifer]|uniref:carbamoyltransferase C-terminal domain-containing protein n=1 Tax=Streptomyces clavifer TaxID=68188 RepID=UPI0033FEEA1F